MQLSHIVRFLKSTKRKDQIKDIINYNTKYEYRKCDYFNIVETTGNLLSESEQKYSFRKSLKLIIL